MSENEENEKTSRPLLLFLKKSKKFYICSSLGVLILAVVFGFAFFKKSTSESFDSAYSEGKELLDKGDVSNGLKKLTLAAKHNHPNAQFELFVYNYDQISEDLDQKEIDRLYSESIYWLFKSALNDLAEAQYLLGINSVDITQFKWRSSAEKDLKKYIKHSLDPELKEEFTIPFSQRNWLKLAAEQDHAKAQYSLGMSYLEEVPKDQLIFDDQNKDDERYALRSLSDSSEAIYWLLRADENGVAEAAYQVALLYENDELVEDQDVVDYLKIAADETHKNELAAYRLAISYNYGLYGLKKNQNEAKKYNDLALEYSQNSMIKKYYDVYGLSQQELEESETSQNNFQELNVVDASKPDKASNPQTKSAAVKKKGTDTNARASSVASNTGLRRAQNIASSVKEDKSSSSIDDVATRLEKDAKSGDATAQLELARRYETGRGVERDWKKAFSWYEKAANQGDVEAIFSLGYCYLHGIGVEFDLKRATQYLQKASDSGNSKATGALAFLLFDGYSLEQDAYLPIDEVDKERAYRLAQASFQEGISAEAALLLGVEANEKGDSQKKQEFATKLGEILAARCDEGDAVAECLLGQILVDVPDSQETGLKLLIDSASKGLAEAELTLGVAYLDGEYGLEQDKETAVRYFQHAVEQRYLKAYGILGLCCLHGDGRPKDSRKALELFEQGAEKADPECLYRLARLYHDGEQVAADYKKAFQLFDMASQRGSYGALCWKGFYLTAGYGGEKDGDSGFEMIFRALDHGDQEIQENVVWFFQQIAQNRSTLQETKLSERIQNHANDLEQHDQKYLADAYRKLLDDLNSFVARREESRSSRSNSDSYDDGLSSDGSSAYSGLFGGRSSYGGSYGGSYGSSYGGSYGSPEAAAERAMRNYRSQQSGTMGAVTGFPMF